MKEVSYMYIQYKLNLKKMSGMGPEIIKIKDILPGKIVIDNPIIRNIEIQFQENQDISTELLITFQFNSEKITLEDTKKCTDSLLNNITNLLVYKLHISISEPQIYAYNTTEARVVASGSITIYKPEHYQLPELDYDWIGKNINSSDLSEKLKTSVHFQMYKSILSVENIISRFLLMYSVLYDLKGEQYNVDRYIKSKEPTTLMIPTTKTYGKKNPETVYTWWRNQSLHMQDDTLINEIIKNYSQLIDGLQQIVFQAIIESLN